LRAAEQTFGTVGYSGTTMNEIADAAGVGVATVYKYFKTKVGILNEIIWPELEQLYLAAEKIIKNPPDDPGIAMSELTNSYRHLKNDWSSRTLLYDVYTLATSNKDAAVAELVRAADSRVQMQIRDLLLVLRARSAINPDLNLDDATFIIFSVFNEHYNRFISHKEIKPDEIFSAMSRRIKTLFSNWRREGPPK
jgi:AcrR family transcriptional regulator